MDGIDQKQLGLFDCMDYFFLPKWIGRNYKVVSGTSMLATSWTNEFEFLPCAQHLSNGHYWIWQSSTSFQHCIFGMNTNRNGQISIFLHNVNLQLHNYAGDFIISSFLAMVLYLTLEEPILRIENYFYKQASIKSKKESN